MHKWKYLKNQLRYLEILHRMRRSDIEFVLFWCGSGNVLKWDIPQNNRYDRCDILIARYMTLLLNHLLNTVRNDHEVKLYQIVLRDKFFATSLYKILEVLYFLRPFFKGYEQKIRICMKFAENLPLHLLSNCVGKFSANFMQFWIFSSFFKK